MDKDNSVCKTVAQSPNNPDNKSPRTRLENQRATSTSSQKTVISTDIITELRKLTKHVTAIEKKMDEKFEKMATLFESTFLKLQEESTTVSKLQGELHNRQKANDFFDTLKNTKRRLFERQAHHYKHCVFNKNKADLFTTFLSAKDNGSHIFIPRKYRLKIGNVKNKEVASIKVKESLQKMENDIDCMREYSDSHQAQALAIEEELAKSVEENSTISTEAKVQIRSLIEDYLSINKQKTVEEWSKKEKFFLTLQNEYFEKLSNKKTPQPTQDVDEELVELLMALGDETEPESQPETVPPKTVSVPQKTKENIKKSLPAKKVNNKTKRQVVTNNQAPSSNRQNPLHNPKPSFRQPPVERRHNFEEAPKRYNEYPSRYEGHTTYSDVVRPPMFETDCQYPARQLPQNRFVAAPQHYQPQENHYKPTPQYRHPQYERDYNSAPSYEKSVTKEQQSFLVELLTKTLLR